MSTRAKKLFVGTGRSGSGYTSKLLTLNGITCGHEIAYTPSTHGPIGDNYDAESSWLAAPFLEKLKNQYKIYHIIRDPKKVVESFVTRQFFVHRDTCPWYNFMLKYVPKLQLINDPTEAAIYFIVEWSKLIERQVPGKFYRLEDNWHTLLVDLNVTNPKEFSNKQYNTNNPTLKKFILDLDTINLNYKQMLIEHGDKYGYQI